MRLSNIQILLTHFFLITFLTLFFKPGAKAQETLFANNSAYNDHRQNRSFIRECDGCLYLQCG